MKYKVFSIIFSILLVITLPLALCSCSTQKSSKNDEIILRIANWEEYLDEGDWDDDEEIELENGKKIIGRNSMIKDFENWYEKTYHKKVKVEYSTFGTNEDMYNQLTIGDTYDLICPSEYMTMKLMAENKILKYSDEFWDTSDANNYYAKGVSPYIKKSLDQLKYQGQSVGDYTAGYMWGTLGYVYNPKYVSREDAEDWGLLLNQKYYKKITAKDSVRDCYFAVRGMQTQKEILTKEFQNQSNYKERLSSLLNDTSDQSIQNAGMILSKIKDNVYSFETDSGKADLVSGKVVANLQWSGDGVYSMQQVEEEGIKLRYAVPKASTNLWFDGWCMLKAGIGKDKEKQQAEKILREQGVDEETIQKLREYDWNDFNAERRFREHQTSLLDCMELLLEEKESGESQPESVEALLDTVENEELLQILLSTDKKTLQMVVLKMMGYAPKEISHHMELPEQTVYTRLRRLREKIKKSMKFE